MNATIVCSLASGRRRLNHRVGLAEVAGNPLVSGVAEETLEASGVRPLSVEGIRRGHWVLMDYGEVIVHVFYQPVREFYDLERLWEHASRVQLPEPLRSQALAGR